MAFGNNFGKNKVNERFKQEAQESINKVKEEGRKIADENEKLFKKGAKTALGCSGIGLLMGIILVCLVVYFIIKLFKQ